MKLARKGVTTANDVIAFMAALSTDAIESKVPAQLINASCNATGKLLKTVEMQLKYGRSATAGAPRRLALTA